MGMPRAADAGVTSYSRTTFSPYEHLKRFTFDGALQLSFKDYSTDYSSRSYKQETETETFQQRYILVMNGYIYDPRLALFTVGISYDKTNEDTKVKGGGFDTSIDSKTIQYDVSARILPFRPLSFYVYASKNNLDYGGTGVSLGDTETKYYGVDAFFTKKNFPTIKFSYYHWESSRMVERGRVIRDEYYDYGDDYDYGFGDEEGTSGLTTIRERWKEKTKIDRYSFNIRGQLKFINTTYNILGETTKYSTTFRDDTYRFFRANTITRIRKDISLINYFQYSDLNYTKYTSFSSHLNLPTIKGFTHSYSYEYLTSEDDVEKDTSHSLSAYWHYRFSNRLSGKVTLRYKTTEVEPFEDKKRDEEMYHADLSVSYTRPIKRFDFSSKYILAFGQDNRQTDYQMLYNNIILKLAYRRLRFAQFSLQYDGSYRKIDYSGRLVRTDGEVHQGGISYDANYFQHILTLGVDGQGPGRTTWTAEGEIRYFDSSGSQNGDVNQIYFGEDVIGEKNRQLVARVNIRYPIFIRGSLILIGKYLTGTADFKNSGSQELETYYYEGRFNYSLMRNMNMTAYWKQEWYNQGWARAEYSSGYYNTFFGQRSTEYGLQLTYYWRKVFIHLEYITYNYDQESSTSKVRRFYLLLSRRF